MPSMAAIPNRATKPIAEDTLKAVWVAHSAKMPPRFAMGITLAASSASRKLWKFKYSNSTINAIDSGTTTIKREIASCRLPNSPTHSRRYPPGRSTCSSTARCASSTALPRSRPRTLNLIGT